MGTDIFDLDLAELLCSSQITPPLIQEHTPGRISQQKRVSCFGATALRAILPEIRPRDLFRPATQYKRNIRGSSQCSVKVQTHHHLLSSIHSPRTAHSPCNAPTQVQQ